jgi:ribosomal-protein-alanine N-acetyltransferase
MSDIYQGGGDQGGGHGAGRAFADAEPRVYLREVSRRDRQEFLTLMQESRNLHDPWIHPPLTPLGFQNYLTRTQRDDHEGLLVCLRDTHEIVGVINLNNIVRGTFLSATLGYYASSRHAGRGLMQEGLTLAKQHAFRSLGLHRLEANIQPDNHRSIALVRRCGFVKEGISPAFLFLAGRWRDHERWAVYDPRTTLHA